MTTKIHTLTYGYAVQSGGVYEEFETYREAREFALTLGNPIIHTTN